MLCDCPLYAADIQTALDNVPRLFRLRGKRVMVVGAAGLMGSFLVDMLLAFNRTRQGDVDILAVDSDGERLRARFAADERLHLLAQNIMQPLSSDLAADFIIHAASHAYPAAFARDPVGTMGGNLFGTYHLLQHAYDVGAERFLLVSSGEVYGQGEPSAGGFVETDSGYVNPTAVRSCYPISKRAAETLCVSFTQQYGLETVIVRPCHTYGPTATDKDNRANVQFVNNAVAGEDIVLQSLGAQRRSYCYVADGAAAILTVLLGGKSGEAYNIANAAAVTTVRGFAEAVARETGVRVCFSQPDAAASAQQTAISYAVLDSRKLGALGWRGQYTVEEGVRQTVRILQEIRG